MSKNKSEKQTVTLSKNSFLNMYVYSNPNKKYPSNHRDEFCDCFIHMANYDIIIQVKQNDEPKAKDWFKNKVLRSARLQLTASFAVLCSPEFEIWDEKNKNIISKCGQNPKHIYPVIVFKKDNPGNYQQVCLPEIIKGTNNKSSVPCNIFSMEDFEYATSMIPTGPNFIDYLAFRFNKLKDLEPGIQLYPFFKKNGGMVFLKNATTNEEIMVAEYLNTLTDKPKELLISAKKWHDNIVGLEEQVKIDRVFLNLLSYLRIEDLPKWDSLKEELVKKSSDDSCIWCPEPILKGNVDGKKYGMILSYLPREEFNIDLHEADKEIINDAQKAINDYSLAGVFVFQYTKAMLLELLR